ncbi:hypothetical protein FACS189491_02250 [Spirochaetia bacterium]|nr:hypothetical protein FACS189491_02250 [Spirochaetia bacterium]
MATCTQCGRYYERYYENDGGRFCSEGCMRQWEIAHGWREDPAASAIRQQAEQQEQNAAARAAWPEFERKYGSLFMGDIPDWFVGLFTIDTSRGRYKADNPDQINGLLEIVNAQGGKADRFLDTYFWDDGWTDEWGKKQGNTRQWVLRAGREASNQKGAAEKEAARQRLEAAIGAPTDKSSGEYDAGKQKWGFYLDVKFNILDNDSAIVYRTVLYGTFVGNTAIGLLYGPEDFAPYINAAVIEGKDPNTIAASYDEFVLGSGWTNYYLQPEIPNCLIKYDWIGAMLDKKSKKSWNTPYVPVGSWWQVINWDAKRKLWYSLWRVLPGYHESWEARKSSESGHKYTEYTVTPAELGLDRIPKAAPTPAPVPAAAKPAPAPAPTARPAPAPSQAVPAVKPVPVPAPGGKACASCGAPLTAGAKFCGKCGAKAAASPQACAKCGAPLAVGAKFCGKCGAKAT